MKNKKIDSHKLFMLLVVGMLLSLILELFMDNYGVISMIFISVCMLHDILINLK